MDCVQKRGPTIMIYLSAFGARALNLKREIIDERGNLARGRE